MSDKDEEREELPESSGVNKATRAALQIAGGVVPFAGGFFSLAAGKMSEEEQRRINEFLHHWLMMLKDEFREKETTISEIIQRVDLQDERIEQRVKSEEYQTLLKKAFRKWAGAESKTKREIIRNILANAAATDLTSDDVLSLFLDWLNDYSEFHFAVIGEVYRSPGVTRLQIWNNLGKGAPREDSAEADLYKLLIRDLSTGSVIRQFRNTDADGNFYARKNTRRPRSQGAKKLKSAFDDVEPYELTELGKQFVHYAMTDLPIKLQFDESSVDGAKEE